MKSQMRKLNRGFTIIEVMIVLAIAGLILAIVFIAVPQLQRNTRDNARQNIASRVKAELETYASNNQGVYPFSGSSSSSYTSCTGVSGTQSCNDWYSRYITSGNVNILDPSTGQNTNISIGWDSSPSTTPAATWAKGTLNIAVGAKCAGEQPTGGTAAGSPNSKQYTVMIALDRTGTWYCLDNG